MAIELHHLNTHGMMEQACNVLDGVVHLKEHIAELEKENQTLAEDVSDKIESITELMELVEKYKSEKAELEDKCQMHDFFWDGCGFAKRGFKNTIAVSEAFDRLEAENRRLKRALWLARSKRAFAEYFFWNHIAFDKKYAKNKFTISHSNSTNINSNKVLRTPSEWSDFWYDVEFKCNAYADKLAKEYK